MPATVSPAARLGIRQANAEDDVRSHVDVILRGVQPEHYGRERRREDRQPFPYPVYLTPVNRDDLSPIGGSLVVLGKHLAERGFDFYHREAITHRYMLATFEHANGERVRFLMELTWCRFTRCGWYENGGRFLRFVPETDE